MTPFEQFLDKLGACLRTAVRAGSYVRQSYRRGFK